MKNSTQSNARRLVAIQSDATTFEPGTSRYLGRSGRGFDLFEEAVLRGLDAEILEVTIHGGAFAFSQDAIEASRQHLDQA